MRVHELAKELGVASKEILAALEEMGLGGRSASSSVPDEAVPRLRASGGKARPGVKLKSATEEPRPTARPKAKTTAKPAAKAKPASKAKPTAGKPKPAETKPASKRTAEPGPAPSTAEPGSAPPDEGPPAPAPGTHTVEVPATAGDGNGRAPVAEGPSPAAPSLPLLKLARGATPQEIAEKTDRGVADVVKILFSIGEMASATQSLSDDVVQLVAAELGYEVELVDVGEEEEPEEEVDESRLAPRPPVVTVMGHVDHGKTKLLDAIRSTNVVAGEFGGITQHIGAYQAKIDDRFITFIDTPGHEAFTAMRARGAQVTDIAVLVVAADDGVMPQTLEALNHARAANVPIIVAVNKIDKPEADPQRVRQQLVDQELVPSEWGGQTEFVDVSAKSHEGLDSLLETILLVAEVEELKADPEGRARGTVIEAHLDKGRGPVATVLVQKGTLDVGDALVSGTAYCKIRAMLDEHGEQVDQAGPSKPVQILGWSSVPDAGDDVREVADEREARHIAQERESRARAAEIVSARATSLQDLLARAREAEVPELDLVVKADVAGSLEALVDAFEKLPQDEVRIRILLKGTGAVTENDVRLALASRAVVVGFNVRPSAGAAALSEKEGVDVRLYRVIYEAIDDVRAALTGLLAPERREEDLGRAEVRALFRVPRVGVVAGCYVQQGKILRGARARLVRDGVIVYDGRIDSLRRFKEDVREVAENYECGIGLENFQDVKEGDVIEAYEVREVARSL